MADAYIPLPPVSWRQPVATASALPTTGNQAGDAIVTQDTEIIYLWNGTSWIAVTAGGGGSPGTVTSVALTDGSVFNVSGSPITTSGTISLSLANQSANTVLAGPTSGGAAPSAFRALVSADIPTSVALTGTPTAPTAGVGTSTTQLATTAFVQSQGFLTSTGSIPTGEQDNASAQTSATTTFVTCLTTTVTLTQTAPILAVANATLTTTGSASVAGYRITINAVASRTALQTLSATATNYLAAIHFISASLSPGTYTVTFDIQRSSGTGTVNYASGTLVAEGLQGTNSNGITSISGLGLSVGPGSGAQSLTGTLTLAGGGTNASLTATNGAVVCSTASALALTAAGSSGQILRSAGAASPTWSTATYPASTTINQLLYSSANNVIAGLASANTGALVTSSTGVPSIASGTTANRLLRTNGTTVSFAQAVLTSDVSGILPGANGGTGATMFAAARIPFSNGTTYVADALFQYTTANTRFFVGQGGGTGRINGTVSLTDPTPGDVAGNFFSRTTTNSCVNIQNENSLPTIDMTNSGGAAGANILSESSRGTLPARTQSQVGDSLFTLTAHGRTASAWSAGFAATVNIVTTEAVTDTNNGGEIVLSTTPNGGAAPVERIRIKQGGETVFQQAIATANFTTAQKNALTPSPGWVVYDTDLNKLSYYNGTTWVNL